MSSSDDQNGSKAGHRKDGKPYKNNNTREDGSYKVGRNRPDQRTQFKAGDGRKRGKREKGSKNQSTIWDKALSRKMTINGETQTAEEWLIDAMIRRGITRSDRAAEKSLEQGQRRDRARERTVAGREDEIIAAYMKQRMIDAGSKVSEDQEDGCEDAPRGEQEATDEDQG